MCPSASDSIWVGVFQYDFRRVLRPIVKVGADEVIFKMYQMSNFTWQLEGKKAIAPKTEGKGNMEVVFVDKAMGEAGNAIPADVWERFMATRPTDKFDSPDFVNWEYGKGSEEKGMGYWTADYMNRLVPEYIVLFETCYPGHEMVLNIDWSSNHSAMSPDARTLGNMRVLPGGSRKKRGNDNGNESMPIFEKYVLQKEDVGPNVPTKWKRRVKAGKQFHFSFVRGEKPFYASPDDSAEDFAGLPIGKRECAYHLGWWKDDMTENGRKAAEKVAKKAPTQFQAGDLVVRNEPKNLDEAKETNTGGDEADFLRLLLCDDDIVDDIGDNEDSNGVHKEKNSGVSDCDIQNSMRSEMIFKYDKVVDGSKQRWVELHVDLLSPEVRRECATVVNG